MRRAALIFGLLAFLATGSAALSRPSLPPPGTRFAATADAYVLSSAKRRNFGRAKVLRVQARPLARSYLRFSIAGLDAPVTGALLRVNALKASSGFTVRAASTKWTERGIKYANAPRPGRIVVRSGRIRRRGTVTVNVAPLVTGNGVVSMVLTGGAVLGSRESGHGPALYVSAVAPTLLAAGDIASCASTGDEATAALVETLPAASVAALGQ